MMNKKERLKSLFLLTIGMTMGSSSAESMTAITVPLHQQDRELGIFQGDDACKCLPFDQLPPPPTTLRVAEKGDISDVVSNQEYGVGCGSHDMHIPDCNDTSSAGTWCWRAWCWVDPNQCSLLNRRAKMFPGRWWSYAACRNMDFYSAEQRIESLHGRTIRIALNHNTGGWQGAYSDLKTDFEGPLSNWHGPTVEFIRIAAARANMRLQVMNVPREIDSRSENFFGSRSTFDRCIYAASLGLIDMCVGAYTMTTTRASSSDFAVLGAKPIRLVIKEDFFLDGDASVYAASIATIFQPLKLQSWIFIIFFVIPLLGILIMINEYGITGSAYPAEEPILDSYVDDHDEQRVEVTERHVPIMRHVARTLYVTLLAVLQGEYPQQVVSLGGQITLFGIGFFLLTIVAVYTANLSALLVAEVRFGRVETLNDVIGRGQRICASRVVMEEVIAIHDIGESFFLVDPPEEGGDGKPGFACPNCLARQRVFDFLDPEKAKIEKAGPTARYCHAALASEEDLDLFHANRTHCNKTASGDVVSDHYWGLPLFAGVSTELTTLILKLKNENLLSQLLLDADLKPQPQCSGVKITVADETSELNIIQLTGIWVVSGLFALTGLLITFIRPHLKKKKRRREGHHIHALARYDQTGQRISRMEHGMGALEKTLNSDKLDFSRRDARGKSVHDDDSDTSPISHDSIGQLMAAIDRTPGISSLAAEKSPTSRRRHLSARAAQQAQPPVEINDFLRKSTI